MTTRSTSARAAIGLVPQEIAVYPELTAREKLRFFGRLYEPAAKKLDRRLDEVRDVIGLRERAVPRASALSAGMKHQQSVATVTRACVRAHLGGVGTFKKKHNISSRHPH